MSEASADPKAIGRAVRNKRRDLGMTQEALARQAGVSLSSVQSAERGNFKGRPYTLPKITEALGLELNDLDPYNPVTPADAFVVSVRSERERRAVEAVLAALRAEPPEPATEDRSAG